MDLKMQKVIGFKLLMYDNSRLLFNICIPYIFILSIYLVAFLVTMSRRKSYPFLNSEFEIKFGKTSWACSIIDKIY